MKRTETINFLPFIFLNSLNLSLHLIPLNTFGNTLFFFFNTIPRNTPCLKEIFIHAHLASETHPKDCVFLKYSEKGKSMSHFQKTKTKCSEQRS